MARLGVSRWDPSSWSAKSAGTGAAGAVRTANSDGSGAVRSVNSAGSGLVRTVKSTGSGAGAAERSSKGLLTTSVIPL